MLASEVVTFSLAPGFFYFHIPLSQFIEGHSGIGLNVKHIFYLVFSFIGIGFAFVKHLVAVDIGFTLLAHPHRLLSTMCRWGFSFPPLHAAHLPEESGIGFAL